MKPESEIRETADTLLWIEAGGNGRQSLGEYFEDHFHVVPAVFPGTVPNSLSARIPDLILIDTRRAGDPVISLCRNLKDDIRFFHVPLLLLAEEFSSGESAALWRAGADALLVAPEPEVLTACCRGMIEKHERLRRYYFTDFPLPETPHTASPDDQLLIRAVTVVNRHIDDIRFDVRLFAQGMGLSRTYLFEKIKRITGRTPNEFILGIRLRRALEMVVNRPEMKMTEIAYESGFSSPSYLIQCFKKEFGKTPGACRKQTAPGNEKVPAY